jgi:hypothetical protein
MCFTDFLTTKKGDQFKAWLGGKDEILFKMWFLDEACFYLDGTVSKQNMQFWGMELSEDFHGRSSHGGKVTVWVAMSSHSVISSFVFNGIVNSEWYLLMHQNDFLLQLTANDVPLRTQWDVQDGAFPHTANVMLDLLNTVSGPCIMSDGYLGHQNCGNFWPSLTPDLNLCDFILWGFLKESCFLKNHPVDLR